MVREANVKHKTTRNRKIGENVYFRTPVFSVTK